MPHPVLSPAKVAVVTGGASGIGLAAAHRFAELGMKVCIADIGSDKLDAAKRSLIEAAPGGAEAIITAECDVRDLEQVSQLERKVRQRFGAVHVLMNNAGIQPGSSIFNSTDNWQPPGQSLGHHIWYTGLRAEHDRARLSGPRHQHRIEAGYHDPARRPGL